MNIYEQKIITGQVHWSIKELSVRDSFEFDGLCSIPMEAEIYIDKELIGERAIDVLLHECLHAMEHMHDVDLPEETIGKLGNMLGKLFVENPWLTAHISEQVNIELQKENDGNTKTI